MQIDATYPALVPLARTFASSSDELRNAQAMVVAYEDTWDDLAELSYGHPDAYHLLRSQADQLARITQAVGSVHHWTLQQHLRLHVEGHRLLGTNTEFLKPTWTENP